MLINMNTDIYLQNHYSLGITYKVMLLKSGDLIPFSFHPTFNFWIGWQYLMELACNYTLECHMDAYVHSTERFIL